MDAAEFARKWKGSAGRENASAQEHFADLCRLVGELTPNEADPSQTFYTFEKETQRSSGPRGRVDVWLKDKFAWEYKGKHKDLRAAYKQCLDYHEALGNPPLLVVCDLERFEVHTKWTAFESWVYHFSLDDLLGDQPVRVTTSGGGEVRDAPDLRAIQLLKALWTDPTRLKPKRTTEEITKEAALLFEKVASDLGAYDASADARRIAHFVSQMVFCMFAGDIGLLPRDTFSRLLEQYARDAKHARDTDHFRDRLAALFRVMQDGGVFGVHRIPCINGDLFTDDDVPEVPTADTIRDLQKLDTLNWSDVEPTIFGTLFEGVLDKSKRKRLGAHYTSRKDIEMLVEPVLMEPLQRQWEEVLADAEAARQQARRHNASEATQQERVRERVEPFLNKLAKMTVLDPACGSGNFLYVSLALLKELERKAIAYAGLQGVTFKPRVHPRQLGGIETDPYAHELASMVIWIGYLQWKHRNGIPLTEETPVLEKLDAIKLMDAIVDRGTRDAGRGTRDAGRGTRDAGRGTRDAGRGTRDSIHSRPIAGRVNLSGPPPTSSSAIRPSSAASVCAKNSATRTSMTCLRFGGSGFRQPPISVATGTRRRARWWRTGRSNALACSPRREFAAARTARSSSGSRNPVTSSSRYPTVSGSSTERQFRFPWSASTTAPRPASASMGGQSRASTPT